MHFITVIFILHAINIVQSLFEGIDVCDCKIRTVLGAFNPLFNA